MLVENDKDDMVGQCMKESGLIEISDFNVRYFESEVFVNYSIKNFLQLEILREQEEYFDLSGSFVNWSKT